MLPPRDEEGVSGAGELGNDLSRLAFVLRTDDGDSGCDSSRRSNSFRSESELRLFFLGGPVGIKLGCSPIVDSPSDGFDVLLGEVAISSNPTEVLREVGSSCDIGRPFKRPSMSVECDRCNVPREILPAGLSPRVLLLNVRQTDETLESCSDLLFSLVSPPNPNFFLRDDVLELTEPVLADLDLLWPSP
jgi:hypothetical protein